MTNAEIRKVIETFKVALDDFSLTLMCSIEPKDLPGCEKFMHFYAHAIVKSALSEPQIAALIAVAMREIVQNALRELDEAEGKGNARN